MHIFLENEFLTVGIRPLGAELFSVRHKKSDLEYMWSGDVKFWARLRLFYFPCRHPKEDSTSMMVIVYMSRHGFARDQMFDISSQSQMKRFFTLQSSPATFMNYPFQFQLSIGYH